MTQDDKELLLRDLSARLTYGVIVDYKEDEYDSSLENFNITRSIIQSEW